MDNIQIETYNACLVIKIIIDELDMKNTPIISKDIDQKLSALNYPSVIIDLNNISYIDSMGISFLVMLNKSLNSKGQKLAILCSNHSINQVFHVIQMEKFLKLFTNINDSSEYVRKKKDTVIDMTGKN